jgi:hypothetical protein
MKDDHVALHFEEMELENRGKVCPPSNDTVDFKIDVNKASRNDSGEDQGGERRDVEESEMRRLGKNMEAF